MQLSSPQPGDYFKLVAGLMGFGINELNLRSTIDDPPKYTLESRSASLGAWSARYVLPNGSPVELALVQFKKDERTRGRDDILWGEWTVHIKGPLRWEGKDENGREDDGMLLVALFLHDYAWVRGISPTAYPTPPQVTLPAPPMPTTPTDEWLSAASQGRHTRELDRIRTELAPMPLDDGRVGAYMTGRNRNLAEVHDDELRRAGYEHDPCGGVNRIPIQ